MSAENKVLIRRWFEEVWNKGRVTAIDEMMSPRAIVHGLGEEMRGPEAFKPFHTAYRNAFPDVKITIDELIAEGDAVALRWTAAGTHRGDDLGFPATGKAVRFSGMTFGHIENGQVIEGWNTFDQLGMLQQLGVINMPGVRS